VYRYRLFDAEGADEGEAYYAVLVGQGDIIWADDRRKRRVLDVVPVEEEESPFVLNSRRDLAGRQPSW
jgi:hypothetical protein